MIRKFVFVLMLTSVFCLGVTYGLNLATVCIAVVASTVTYLIDAALEKQGL